MAPPHLGMEVLLLIHRWCPPHTRQRVEEAMGWKHPVQHALSDPYSVMEKLKTFPNLLQVKAQYVKVKGPHDISICIPLPSTSFYRIDICSSLPHLWKKRREMTWRLTRKWHIRGHFIRLAVQVDTPDHFLRFQCHDICVTYCHGELRETQRYHVGSQLDESVVRYRTKLDQPRGRKYRTGRGWDTRMTDASFIPLEKTKLRGRGLARSDAAVDSASGW